MKRKRTRKVSKKGIAAAVTVATTAGGLGLTATPASAYVYDTEKKLCSSPDNPIIISPTFNWEPATYVNTSDWNPLFGYSFRTCSWSGTNYNYFAHYDSSNDTRFPWTMNVVGDGSGERYQYWLAPRQNTGVWGFASPPNWGPTHFHLWSPGGSQDNSNYWAVYGFKANVIRK